MYRQLTSDSESQRTLSILGLSLRRPNHSATEVDLVSGRFSKVYTCLFSSKDVYYNSCLVLSETVQVSIQNRIRPGSELLGKG